MIALVVALSSNRVIGRDGALPWRLPTDLRRFRELTTGHAVVMGRRTYESLPERFRPLPDRRNIVLSTRASYAAPGAEVFGDLEAALEACEHDCFVIGGGVSKLGEMVLGPARQRLERALPGRGYRPGPRVVVAELGPQAGLVGAADLVRLAVSEGDA